MDAKRKESMSIMKKIMIAMVTGILLGVVCLWLRESLTAGGNEGTWKLINRIFFQDITQEKGFYSLGLFYIIQQLFMRGLQLAIVPLVLSSLSPCIMQHGRFKETWKNRRKDNWNIRRVLCMRCNISWIVCILYQIHGMVLCESSRNNNSCLFV